MQVKMQLLKVWMQGTLLLMVWMQVKMQLLRV